jgi:hypothetical protein
MATILPTLDLRTSYEQWQEGDISDNEFFNIISGEMYEHDAAKQEAAYQYDQVRSQLEHILSLLEAKLGDGEFRQYKDRLAMRGYTYQNVKPSERRNVKLAPLLKLQKRIQAADPELWDAICACISYTQVAGGVRIGHVKKEEPSVSSEGGDH